MTGADHYDAGPRPEFLAVLGLVPPITVDDVKQAYLDKAKNAHPDRGGNAEDFIRLQRAFEQATEYARFKAGRMQWLSRWVEQYADQQQVVERLRAMGGTVDVEAADALAPSIGQDFATVLDRVVGIRLAGPEIDDDALAYMATERRLLLTLARLELVNTKITDRGLLQLRGFEGLRHLDLTGARISREALEAVLKTLVRLESLVLTGTPISWWARWRLGRRGLSVTS